MRRFRRERHPQERCVDRANNHGIHLAGLTGVMEKIWRGVAIHAPFDSLLNLFGGESAC